MTILFHRSYKTCAKDVRRVNLTFFGGQSVVRCLRVKVSNPKKADHCGLRSVPPSKVSKNSTGYVMGRNISEYEQCGLKLTKTRR